jgi:hypothetical protein
MPCLCGCYGKACGESPYHNYTGGGDPYQLSKVNAANPETWEVHVSIAIYIATIYIAIATTHVILTICTVL